MASGSTWRRSLRAIRPAHVMPNPPVLWDIESDPALAGTKMIAEAWDAAGLYQVGSFVGDSWKEWNGRFRDDVRDFFRGARTIGGARGRPPARQPDASMVTKEREAEQSVNFVTCHDGFTLNDLVSYNAQAQRRRTARTTATEVTTTEAGTAASKGRPTIPPSSSCATGR